MTAPTLFVIDDEPAVRFTLGEIFKDAGYVVCDFEAAQDALDHIGDADAVFTDFMMPGMDGLAFLAAAKDLRPDLPVVMLTARGSEAVAAEALRLGAWDYLVKPFELEVVLGAARRIASVAGLRQDALIGRAERALGQPLVASSPSMVRLIEQASLLASRPVTTLVTGETGTGKELIGALLHHLGDRAQQPLVRFNCAAVPDTLAESTLFGHVAGAFTGARSAHGGHFAQADGGTLILDEVGELSSAVQAKLLRVLQSGEVHPVGAQRSRRVDVRVVACTHRDLHADVRTGRFREDLLYRLAVVELTVPALRERPSDIAPMARRFVDRACRRFGLPTAPLSPQRLNEWAARPWPGNARELENFITGRLALWSGMGPVDWGERADALGQPVGLKAQVEAFERGVLRQTLGSTNGNQSEAARRLQISRSTLVDKLKKYDLC